MGRQFGNDGLIKGTCGTILTGLLTLLTAAVMSESAIDSAQNGINGIISSTFLKVQCSK